MPRFVPLLASLCVLVFAAALPQPAEARYRQYLFPPLADSDIALIQETAQKRFDEGKPGDVYEWDNPETGNKGKVFYLNSFEQDGRECHDIAHRIMIKGESDAYVAKVTSCIMEDGTVKWQF
ncbi:hypothetical protein ACSHT0_06295 [Tepidicaulis sp. LMO-SS28]|uniref:hypothetical protein n=1 Tax=Tepidicaulis sp. LMO-SS28 TaxID=3447455 RepID=UPI003EE207A8